MAEQKALENLQEIKLADLEGQFKELMLQEYQAEESLREIRKAKNNLAKLILDAMKQLHDKLVAINKAFSAVYGGKSTYLLAVKLDPRNYAEELKEGVLTEPYQVGLLTQGKGRLIFVPGGYLVNDPDLNIIGAVGVSGFPQSVGMGDINDMTAAIIGVSAFYD